MAETSELSAVSQVSLSYLPEEDRILMRVGLVGENEYLAWFTRRCIRLLWPILTDILAQQPRIALQVDSEAREALLAYEHDRALGESDFATPYALGDGQSTLASHELTHVDSAVTEASPDTGFVVVRLQTVKNEETGVWSLALLPFAGKGMTLALTLEFCHAFAGMVQQAVEAAEWDLSLTLSNRQDVSSVHADARQKLIH